MTSATSSTCICWVVHGTLERQSNSFAPRHSKHSRGYRVIALGSVLARQGMRELRKSKHKWQHKDIGGSSSPRSHHRRVTLTFQSQPPLAQSARSRILLCKQKLSSVLMTRLSMGQAVDDIVLRSSDGARNHRDVAAPLH